MVEKYSFSKISVKFIFVLINTKVGEVLLKERIFRYMYKFKMGFLIDGNVFIFQKLKNKLVSSELEVKNGENGISYVSFGDVDMANCLQVLLNRNHQEKIQPIRCYSELYSNVEKVKEDCKLYNCKKIFFAGENLIPYIKHNTLILNDYAFYNHVNYRIKNYSEYLLDDVDLALGFAEIDNSKYMRFPGWILYNGFFSICDSYNEIQRKVRNINAARSSCLKECICINSHDAFGFRTKIADDLNGILDITYAGKWRNNTSELWDKYENDKLKYMNLFRFNICPENMDAPHYCTEKIFDSFRAGCIPIYAGALNNPEPDVINKDAVIFWNLDGDNTDNIKLIKKLNTDDNFYNKFLQQEKLLPSAAEYVYDRFIKLENKFREILDD